MQPQDSAEIQRLVAQARALRLTGTSPAPGHTRLMRFLVLSACLVVAAPVAADSAVKRSTKASKAAKVQKASKAEKSVKPAEEPAAMQTCKRKVVGRGLDRKVVCELDELVVRTHAPRPNVIVVQTGGRQVTGRPKVTDPLAGLSRRLETP